MIIKNGTLAIVVIGLVLLQNSAVFASDSSSVGKTKSPMHWTNLPKQTLGIVTGIIVGVPVCVAHKVVDEEKSGIKGLIGDNHKPILVVPSAVCWAPFAAMTGVMEAPFYAVNNSIVNYEKPFSKEQFSLVEDTIKDPSQAQAK